MTDMACYRDDFPILARQVNDMPLCYLDNAASAQKPRAVMEAMRHVQESEYANVHRGLHYLANVATQNFENARAVVQRFIHAAALEEIIFTSGATDAINLVAYSFLAPTIKAGDEIILSQLEHHSNIVPWHFLRERYGAVLKWLPCNIDGTIQLDDYEALFSDKTRLVAITQTSNVLGTHMPLAEMIPMAHHHQVPVLVDGCQGIAHGRIDVQALGCDFYVFSGHKLYGPTGIGVLYGKRALLEAMPPFRGGGEMIHEVSQEAVVYGQLPHRFEAGTPPIIEAAGMAAAIDYVEQIGWDYIARHEDALLREATEGLRKINHLHLFAADLEQKAPIISFNVDKVHPHDIAQLLDQQGVAIRAGHHCAQPLMARLGASATARASFAFYNSRQDVAQFVKALEKAIGFFS